MIETRCTVSFTTTVSRREDLAGNYLHHTHSGEPGGKELEVQVRGFCLNTHCRSQEKGFILSNKIYMNTFSTENKKIFSCPQCNSALFWTKKYAIDEEAYSKKMNKCKGRRRR